MAHYRFLMEVKVKVDSADAKKLKNAGEAAISEASCAISSLLNVTEGDIQIKIEYFDPQKGKYTKVKE